MNKGAQRGKNQSGPGSAGHGRTRQAARRERPPAGLPTSGALSAVAAAAGRGRPSLSRAAPPPRGPRPGRKPGPRRLHPPALATRPGGLRAPPARAAWAARLPHSPGWRWRGRPAPPGLVGRTRGRERGADGGGGRGGRKAGWGRSGPGRRRRRRLQPLAANRVPAPPCVSQGAAARAARRPPRTRGPTRVRAIPRARE